MLCVVTLFFYFDVSKAQAQVSVVDTGKTTCNPCDSSGTTATTVSSIYSSLIADLTDAECEMKEHAAEVVDDMMETLLTELNVIELVWIQWWNTWWYHDKRPRLQGMTEQFGLMRFARARMMGQLFDAEEQHYTQQALQESELRAHRNYRPSEQVCVAGTQSGGFGRSYSIVRHMRDAREREMTAIALHKDGTLGQKGNSGLLFQKWEDYTATFCDTALNAGTGAGESGCTVNGILPNGDILVTDLLLEDLTIDVRVPERRLAMRRMVDNLVEPNITSTIQRSALAGSTGQQNLLARRSLAARRAVARSIPEYIASLRMPGSDMETWVRALRQDAGVSAAAISTDPNYDPSYKEVMHAITVEKFTNGRYALSTITGEAQLRQERLVLSSLYLMQLRDYYELLERMALSMAVQVAVMVDEIPPALAVPTNQ